MFFSCICVIFFIVLKTITMTMMFTVPEGIRSLLSPVGGGTWNWACDDVADFLRLWRSNKSGITCKTWTVLNPTHWVRQRSCSGVITHLHGLAAEEVDVRLLLVSALADKQKQWWEEFFSVYGLAAVDGFKRVMLQLILCEKMILKVIMHADVTYIHPV